MAEPLTPDNFPKRFRAMNTVYVHMAKNDPTTAAIREAYGPVYRDFFPLETLRGLHCDDDRKNEILDQLQKDFLKNDGDFAYAILRASHDMLKEGAQFAPDYRAKLELVVADMWRKMGALAEKDGGSATALIYKKCARSAEAIEMLQLDAAHMLRLAQDPSELRAEAEMNFPELGQAMDKMAAISGEVPHSAIGNIIRKGHLLPAASESVTRL